ncbi:MAG: GntR family transcriptional regulator [Spirochaetia bacterium]
MQFSSGQSIYLQISDYICEKILRGDWKEGDRIPSIRETAVSVEVNPNTVTRAYSVLQDQGIIQNQRGIGYFVAPGGEAATAAVKRREFIAQELPRLVKTMELLGMTFEELKQLYDEFEKEKQDEANQ